VTFNKERQADLEDALADQEHAVEARLHKVAEKLPDPAHGHQRADAISEGADRHRRRARALRRQP
jgi:phage terminase small subunit